MIYLKKHKIQIIGASLLTIFVLVFAYIIISIAYPENSTGLYGTRLLEIKNYPIDIKKINTTKEKLISTEKVNKVSYKLQGKIINFVINVKKDVDKEAGKTLAKTVLEAFTDLELKYYDVQVFVINEESKEGYPLIGYKHHTSLEIVWSNNSI